MAGSVGFGPRAGSLRGGVGRAGCQNSVMPGSVRRGDVSRIVGVTKPFARCGVAVWVSEICDWVRCRDDIPYMMTARLCSENLSREKNPWVCDCEEPSALQLSFGLEYRDIGPTGVNVVVAK